MLSRKNIRAIKPSFYRGTSERVLQRANTEAKAGRFAVDVITSAGFQVQLMKESGLTQRFVPPEAAAYDEGFKDPDGHWVNVHSLLNSMAYNTQLVKPNEAPKKYEDLLAPRWKGRIGVNLQDPEWYVSLQRRWGKDKARNFLKALAAQQPACATVTTSPRNCWLPVNIMSSPTPTPTSPRASKAKAARCNMSSTSR